MEILVRDVAVDVLPADRVRIVDDLQSQSGRKQLAARESNRVDRDLYRLTLHRTERRDVDQRLDFRIVDIGDHRAAVRVPDENDGAVDVRNRLLDHGRVVSRPAQRIVRHHDAIATRA